MNNTSADFENLGLDQIINAVEEALGQRMTGFASSLPSYINRVYELQTMAGERLIAKFYRPGRWSRIAIEEEHEFMQDCALAEVPVVLPLDLVNGSTLADVDGISFAVLPKRLGRDFEIVKDDDWRRIGTLISRIHNAGQAKEAPNRIRLHPLDSTRNDVRQLIEGGFLSLQYKADFQKVCEQIMEIATDLFEDTESIRIHGDCHSGNVLYRPESGIMLIDFDDMMMGPPIQDLWLLLPEYADKCRRETALMIEGYEMFRSFDRKSVKLIEPLRAMRIIYFLAWCSRQANDLHFANNYPGWGTESFWSIEMNALSNQLQVIIESLKQT
ncbi:MAG: serine/threonine protein kinase [SAR324 cluster bacterium]|nr:serine/threonine protein kinase [SAR324 cluster bacterium]